MGTLLFRPPACRYNAALDLSSVVQPTHKTPAVWDRPRNFFFFFLTLRALLFRSSLTLSEMFPNPTLYRGLKANLLLFRLRRVWQRFITTCSRVALACTETVGRDALKVTARPHVSPNAFQNAELKLNGKIKRGLFKALKQLEGIFFLLFFFF